MHCSLQHYLQYTGHESNLDVHQQMNGYRSCGTYVQWNVSHRMEQFESVVLRWMNLDPVKQSEVSKKEPSFEFWSFSGLLILIHTILMASDSEPQFLVSDKIKRGNNWYTCNPSVTIQPFCFPLSVQYSMDYMRCSKLYYKWDFVLEILPICRLIQVFWALLW